jgi:HK97 gp10 family phage protein
VKTSVIITGIPQIDRKLKRLPIRIQKKVVRQSIRKSLKVMQAEVVANAPVYTGVTKQNVKVRAVKTRKRGSIELEVKVAGDDKLYKVQANGTKVFYPAIVEYKKNAFMRRSFDTKGEAVRNLAIQLMKVGVEVEARKA